MHPQEYRLEMFVREAVGVGVRGVQVGEMETGGVSQRGIHVESDKGKKKLFGS